MYECLMFQKVLNLNNILTLFIFLVNLNIKLSPKVSWIKCNFKIQKSNIEMLLW